MYFSILSIYHTWTAHCPLPPSSPATLKMVTKSVGHWGNTASSSRPTPAKKKRSGPVANATKTSSFFDHPILAPPSPVSFSPSHPSATLQANPLYSRWPHRPPSASARQPPAPMRLQHPVVLPRAIPNQYFKTARSRRDPRGVGSRLEEAEEAEEEAEEARRPGLRRRRGISPTTTKISSQLPYLRRRSRHQLSLLKLHLLKLLRLGSLSRRSQISAWQPPNNSSVLHRTFSPHFHHRRVYRRLRARLILQLQVSDPHQ